MYNFQQAVDILAAKYMCIISDMCKYAKFTPQSQLQKLGTADNEKFVALRQFFMVVALKKCYICDVCMC